MSRICNACHIDLSLDNYHNCKSFPLGKTYTCKNCARLRSVDWNKDNVSRKKATNKIHYENNTEAYKQRSKDLSWSKHNPERARESARKRYEKDPSIYFKSVAMRRKRVKQAILLPKYKEGLSIILYSPLLSNDLELFL